MARVCMGPAAPPSVPSLGDVQAWYGGVGAAWSVLAGTSLRLLVSWIGIVQYLRLPFPRLWLNRQDLAAARDLFI